MRVDELDFVLPDELIAQTPVEVRHDARLLALDPEGGRIEHRFVRELPSLLPKSLIVVNDTKVFPARLLGRRPSGGKAEIFLVEKLEGSGKHERWATLGRASKRLAPGHELLFGEGRLVARIERRRDDETWEVSLFAEEGVDAAIEALGAMPLPPYVRRAASSFDEERYQTIFASERGAVAAPTAGLHFTPALVAALEAEGHRFARVTLHVGLGTFLPVKVDDLDRHPMHTERYRIPEVTAAAIALAREEGRPVLAVGTTVVRALESSADPDARGLVRAGAASTDLLIQPGYDFRVVDSLITNFHLPRSTLLALVMAFAGVEETRAAYRAAIEARYRFYSYGDAMWIRRRKKEGSAR
ncbi:MAG: tRNA preQ1(34) S-adenosylmethionine ribosyltransferase-isomerase QueA [Myxococcales bacterium]|nr:tRNA preQ1(34) S-adenosylmethionine ribosyltransferase-isomerase QueA [Myxococcales bacterium]